MAYGNVPGFARFGGWDTGTFTAFNLNEVWNPTTDGDAVGIRMMSPVSQTSGAVTVYMWCDSIGTTEWESTAYIYPLHASIDERPDTTSPAGTSSESSGDTSDENTWISYAFTNVTLTAGATYFVVATNSHATPSTDSIDIASRGYCDNFSAQGHKIWKSITTDNGFSTNPATASVLGPVVMKFDDGTIVGNPYIKAGTEATLLNGHVRGNRWTFTEDVKISGFSGSGGATALTHFVIYQGASQLLSVALDANASLNNDSSVLFEPYTLTGGTAYDIGLLATGGTGAGLMFGMGETEANTPADVKACRPSCLGGSSEGAPGSMVVDTSEFYVCELFLDDNPAIAGGGGGNSNLLHGKLG